MYFSIKNKRGSNAVNGTVFGEFRVGDYHLSNSGFMVLLSFYCMYWLALVLHEMSV